MESHFEAKKSLGQNFLTSPVIPRLMCEAAALPNGSTVLEIGPGTGALTRELLNFNYRVIAVETDQRAVNILQETFTDALASGQLTIVAGDIKTFDPSSYNLLPHTYAIIANIPYYLSGYLLRTFLSGQTQPHTLVFLMQKELVERIARSKKQSLLSLSVAVYGQPHYYKTVSRGHFLPMPKVDSAILVVQNIQRNTFLSTSEELFFTIIHHGFKQKRKQLISNLRSLLPRETLLDLFLQLEIKETIRAEDVPLTTWLALTRLMTPLLSSSQHLSTTRSPSI